MKWDFLSCLDGLQRRWMLMIAEVHAVLLIRVQHVVLVTSQLLVVQLAVLLINQKKSQLLAAQPAEQETRSDHKVSGPFGPEALKRGSI